MLPARVALADSLRRAPFSSTFAGPPTHVVEDLDGWLGAHPEVEHVAIEPAGRVELPPPVMVEPMAPRQLDSLDVSPEGELSVATAARFVLTIPDGRAFGPDGAIASGRDELLLGLSPDFKTMRVVAGRHNVMTSIRLPRVFHIPGRVAVLATLADHFFSHWLMEMIPRIGLLRAAGFDLAGFDAFYMRSPKTGYERDSLLAAGIPFEKIVDSTAHPHVQADFLVVPSPLREAYVATHIAGDYLNELFVPETCEIGDPVRLFISRRDAAHRHLVNEDEVHAALRPLGFEPVRPETLALAEQAALFARAEAIVAPHGSAHANYLFCRRGAVLVEMQTPRIAQTGCIVIARERGLRYGLVYAAGTDPRQDPLTEDIHIEVPTLLRLLDVLGIS